MLSSACVCLSLVSVLQPLLHASLSSTYNYNHQLVRTADGQLINHKKTGGGKPGSAVGNWGGYRGVGVGGSERECKFMAGFERKREVWV